MAHVLVIDDEELIHRMVGRVLDELGHSHEHASRIVDGEALAATNRFHLIVCDGSFRRFATDGIDLARRLVADGHNVLLFTSHDRPSDFDGQHHLGKPSPMPLIMGKISALLP